MKILIVGQGAREHALGWKFKAENSRHEISFYPGNAGTELTGKNLKGLDSSLRWNDGIEIIKTSKPDLVVIGPEAPLAEGWADNLKALKITAFGVQRNAAQLEASKIFAKNFMAKHGLPTARYKAYENAASALKYLETQTAPIVIKADGLAQGKGAIVAQTLEEARKVITDFMKENRLGEAGKRVVIEEFLQGQELSVQAFFDGSRFVHLPAGRDHKRLTESPEAPMTGGMGVFAPIFPSSNLWDTIVQDVLKPFRAGLEKDNIEYRGVIYFGLMLTADGPKVLEFNVRFGDPETQALVPLTEIPFTELMQATAEGMLSKFPSDLILETLNKTPRHSVCVTLASPGYPVQAKTGGAIEAPDGFFEKSLEADSNFLIFHAGTKRDGDKWVTSGGRVLSCVGLGKTPVEARENAYKFEKSIRFEGMQYRKDIGGALETSIRH